MQHAAGNQATNHLLRQASESGTFQPGGVPLIVHQVFRSHGQALDPAARAFLESRFDRDFGQVRVHADARSAEAASELNSHAFTAGHHIGFGAGQYQPDSEAGQELLAHEATHVLQQSHVAGTPQPTRVVAETSPLEARAEAAETFSTEPTQPAVASGTSGDAGLALKRKRRSSGGKGRRSRGGDAAGCVAKIPAPGISRRELGTATAAGKAAHVQIAASCKRGVGKDDYCFVNPFHFIPGAGRRGASFGVGPDMLLVHIVNPHDPASPVEVEYAEIKPSSHRAGAKRRASRKQLQSYINAYTATTGRVLGEARPMTSFKLNLLEPFIANPKQMLKAWGPVSTIFRRRGRRPGGIQEGGLYFYECTPDPDTDTKKDKDKKKGQKKQDKADKTKGQKKQAKGRKPKAKKPATPKGKGGNVGFGIGILSTGGGAGNAGFGVSILSSGESYGTVSAGVVFDSDGVSVGTVSAGVSVSSEGFAGAAAMAGISQQSSGTVLGSVAAGTAKESSGTMVGSAAAGTAEGAEGELTGEAVSGEAQGATGPAGQAEAAEGAGGQGQAGAEGTPGGRTGQAEAQADAAAADLDIPGLTQEQTRDAVQEAGRIDALLQQLSPAQKNLIKTLAERYPNDEFRIPASAWLQIIRTATKGISEKDIAYLETLEWRPGDTTAEKLRKQVEEALARRQAGQAPGKDELKEKPKAPPPKPKKQKKERKEQGAVTFGTPEIEMEQEDEPEEFLKKRERLRKLAADFNWKSVGVGAVSPLPPEPGKPAPGQFYVLLDFTGTGKEVGFVADAVGTLIEKKGARFYRVQNISILVNAGGDVYDASRFIGTEFELEN